MIAPDHALSNRPARASWGASLAATTNGRQSFRCLGPKAAGVLLMVLLASGVPGGAQDAWFEDKTQSSGVDRPHHRRVFENPYARIMEGYTALGAAAAAADVDGDGLEDLFVTDSNRDSVNSLYLNRGDFTFEEVGKSAGVADGNDARNASADCLWFDYDNDGDPDLLVVRFGRSLLFENRSRPGRVQFVDVTEKAGLDAYLNSIAAIAFDPDLDGDLDILLANYFAPVDLFAPPTSRFFPESFETADNGGGVTLLRNQGDGKFIDVTRESGLESGSWALDVGHADIDHDGDDDIYVAVDFGTDRLFVNRGDGRFDDRSRTAIGIDTKKGMNVDWGDFDGDGLFDVYVTNITDEYMREGNFLWRNLGDGNFVDVARETGTHETGWGWAGKFFDYDNDGWLDLYVVDGWVSAGEENYVVDILELILNEDADLTDARNWPPMGGKTFSGFQHNRLFHNRDGHVFVEQGERHGLNSLKDGRGIVVADFDLDGRQDLFVTNAGSTPFLWRNVAPTENAWIAFQLHGSRSNRDAVGARIWVTSGGRKRVSFVNGGNGFASQSTRSQYFGLAAEKGPVTVDVTWPSGLEQRFEGLSPRRIYSINEGDELVRPLPSRKER